MKISNLLIGGSLAVGTYFFVKKMQKEKALGKKFFGVVASDTTENAMYV